MTPLDLTPALLRDWPLPQPKPGSKDDRGKVLVVAGSAELPGTAVLAGAAVLRVGAGRLQIATVESCAVAIGVAMPEARVIPLTEVSDGGAAAEAALTKLTPRAEKVDAVLIGTGMTVGADTTALTLGLRRAVPDLPFVFDAAATTQLRDHADAIRAAGGGGVITPHAGEAARLLGKTREEIEADPLASAREIADLLGVVVVMKGAETHIVAPDGQVWLFRGGCVGLATSGSGDVLGGLIAGLLARGADPAQAAAWGVSLHGEAGQVLEGRIGPLGFLARELAGEVPRLLHRLAANQ